MKIFSPINYWQIREFYKKFIINAKDYPEKLYSRGFYLIKLLKLKIKKLLNFNLKHVTLPISSTNLTAAPTYFQTHFSNPIPLTNWMSNIGPHLTINSWYCSPYFGYRRYKFSCTISQSPVSCSQCPTTAQNKKVTAKLCLVQSLCKICANKYFLCIVSAPDVQLHNNFFFLWK